MIILELQKSFHRASNPFTLDISLSFPAQEATVFFGPSGSGKTLTLHCLAGLTTPDHGRIMVKNHLLFDSNHHFSLPARERHIGFMFQDYALFPHLTVLQNVAYARSNFFPNALSSSVKKEAEELLERFRLMHLGKRYPHELSGGQKQRVALIRALNANPEMLLLDEPFSALDPLLRVELRKELRDSLSSIAIPTIIITHDPEDVDAFAKRVVLFAHGHAKMIASYATERKAYPSATECLLALQKRAQSSQPLSNAP